jgi:hypothetical protein
MRRSRAWRRSELCRSFNGDMARSFDPEPVVGKFVGDVILTVYALYDMVIAE